LPNNLASQVKVFSASERVEFEQQVALFIAMYASEISYAREALINEEGQTAQHYKEICNYLFNVGS
jgi:hypothetical protein